jgi:hypothetical protein
VTAVAVWEHAPSADQLLEARLARGWRPTPSYLVSGLQVLGHAALVPRELWTRPQREARCDAASRINSRSSL